LCPSSGHKEINKHRKEGKIKKEKGFSAFSMEAVGSSETSERISLILRTDLFNFILYVGKASNRIGLPEFC
jgi:hypothetical protein